MTKRRQMNRTYICEHCGRVGNGTNDDPPENWFVVYYPHRDPRFFCSDKHYKLWKKGSTVEVDEALEALEKRIRDDLRELATYEEISVLERCQRLVEIKKVITHHMWGQRSIIPVDVVCELSTDQVMELWPEFSRAEAMEYQIARCRE